MQHIKLTFLLILTVLSVAARAQETKPSKCQLTLGADFATSYLWRGFELGNSPAAQAWGEFSYKGFTLGTWGSYSFTGDYKEVDLYAKYTYKTFTLNFVDLFFPGYEDLDQNFFNFKQSSTGHCGELGLSFNGSEKIPFSVFGGVILYGTSTDPDPSDSTKMNYSTYFELKYLGTLNDYPYEVFAGFTPTQSTFYQTDGFAFINLGATVKKSINLTDNFSLPLKFTLSLNPEIKKIYLSLLISI
ncbi:MAG: hypothetical protein ACOYN4_07555 [Bacteroidales bacterium]